MEQNEKDRIDYMISVMQAYKEGKKIEVMDRYSKEEYWELITGEPSWAWDTCDYRIKPEPPKPKYRPFENTDEIIEAIKEHGDLVIWIMDDTWRHKIISFSNKTIRTSDEDVEMNDALRDYTFADGTPFGKLIQE